LLTPITLVTPASKTDKQIDDAFIANYRAIRANPFTRDATIYYVFERNLGGEADTLTKLVKSTRLFSNCEVLSEHADIRGFLTTRQSKIASDDTLRLLVHMGAFYFAEDMFSLNKDLECAPHDRARVMREMLVQQMSDMREYTRRNDDGTVQRIITSTHTAKRERIRGRKDDVQRALSNMINAKVKFEAGTLCNDYRSLTVLKRNREFVHEEAKPVFEQVMAEVNAAPRSRFVVA